MKIYINTNHAKVILRIRHKSYDTAAKQAGMSKRQFCRVINGECEPRPDARMALARKVFPGVAWDNLFKIVEDTMGADNVRRI